LRVIHGITHRVGVKHALRGRREKLPKAPLSERDWPAAFMGVEVNRQGDSGARAMPPEGWFCLSKSLTVRHDIASSSQDGRQGYHPKFGEVVHRGYAGEAQLPIGHGSRVGGDYVDDLQ
jgi:hypothetical protein